MARATKAKMPRASVKDNTFSLTKDGLRNFVSGIGTAKDKSLFNEYYFTPISDEQLLSAYRSSWMVRKGIDIPAADMTREWRGWQAEEKQIEKIEAVEKAFNVKRKVKQAIQRARLFGGSAIVMGFGDNEIEKPLTYEKIKERSLKYLHVFNRGHFTARDLISDINSPWFGEPEYYEIKARHGVSYKVHPSRIVRFTGATLPDDDLIAANRGWGDSVLLALDHAVKDALSTSAGVAAMIQEAKVDVIKIPGLMKKIGEKGYEAQLIERFTLANTTKGILNALILDTNEEWERINQQFGSMPDLLKLYLLIASGAFDIPATRFLGQSAVGLNATGDGDLRNYYDRISSDQKTDLQDDLWRLDQVIMGTALGKPDPNIWYNWHPLWGLDEIQQAEIASKKANTFKVDWDIGTFNQDVLRTIRANQLIEDGTYPGIEAAMEEFPEPVEADLDEEDPNVKEAFNNREEKEEEIIADAKPRTLYVRRDVKNANEILSWAKEQGFKTTLPAEDLHVTIAFSRTAVDWMKMDQDWYASGDGKGELTVNPGGPRMLDALGEKKDAIVLLFSSTDLQWRHMAMREQGASWDWPEYQPHITITYDKPEGMDIDQVKPYRGKIVLGPEIFEEINEDWKTNIKEK